ncbi:hypothetical protein [Streptosporangium roseum]|uniref:hypothetical protein n=1 Tax=Streptosporangium roseum TaxID=2001 RepID=UPI00331EE1AD
MEVPIPWWYGAHLLLALVVAAAPVVAWRAGVPRPRVLHSVVICLNLTLPAVFFPLNEIWLHGPSR